MDQPTFVFAQLHYSVITVKRSTDLLLLLGIDQEILQDLEMDVQKSPSAVEKERRCFTLGKSELLFPSIII